MSSTNNNTPQPTMTNPLQTNNAALTLIAFVAGTLAAKFPMFDAATWNYIIYSVGGVLAVAVPAILNRKTAVVSTVANLPEIKTVEVDKTAPNASAIVDATPSNVVAK